VETEPLCFSRIRTGYAVRRANRAYDGDQRLTVFARNGRPACHHAQLVTRRPHFALLPGGPRGTRWTTVALGSRKTRRALLSLRSPRPCLTLRPGCTGLLRTADQPQAQQRDNQQSHLFASYSRRGGHRVSRYSFGMHWAIESPRSPRIPTRARLKHPGAEIAFAGTCFRHPHPGCAGVAQAIRSRRVSDTAVKAIAVL
jgi:hypothetical protein